MVEYNLIIEYKKLSSCVWDNRVVPRTGGGCSLYLLWSLTRSLTVQHLARDAAELRVVVRHSSPRKQKKKTKKKNARTHTNSMQYILFIAVGAGREEMEKNEEEEGQEEAGEVIGGGGGVHR